MPKISVIMPVYNGERFIVDAIDSLLSQTQQDWELIVVDDGSSDNTPSLLQRYTEPRISVVRQQNQGEAEARNAGLARATGEYVAFLDADDLYLLNALNDLGQYLDEYPDVDSVYSDGYFCDEQGQVLMRLSEHRIGFYTGMILDQIVMSASIITFPVCTMTRRATIEQFGIRFDPTLIIGTDWDFWIHLARYARFGYLDRITCKYRVHETNITRTTVLDRRRHDLVRGRLKVLNSDWFQQLSLLTRQDFFYNLLAGLLADDTAQQMEIFQSIAFRTLPNQNQSRLLRLTATNYLLRNSEPAFAQTCLRQALAACPDDKKSRFLLAISSKNTRLGTRFVRAWNSAQRTLLTLRSIGRRKPKPVPAMLRWSCMEHLA